MFLDLPVVKFVDISGQMAGVVLWTPVEAFVIEWNEVHVVKNNTRVPVPLHSFHKPDVHQHCPVEL